MVFRSLAASLVPGLLLGRASFSGTARPVPAMPVGTPPESLPVTRPLTRLDRGLVAVSTVPRAVTWGAAAAARGGMLTVGACFYDSGGSASDALWGCAIGAGLVIG